MRCVGGRPGPWAAASSSSHPAADASSPWTARQQSTHPPATNAAWAPASGRSLRSPTMNGAGSRPSARRSAMAASRRAPVGVVVGREVHVEHADAAIADGRRRHRGRSGAASPRTVAGAGGTAPRRRSGWRRARPGPRPGDDRPVLERPPARRHRQDARPAPRPGAAGPPGAPRRPASADRMTAAVRATSSPRAPWTFHVSTRTAPSSTRSQWQMGARPSRTVGADGRRRPAPVPAPVRQADPAVVHRHRARRGRAGVGRRRQRVRRRHGQPVVLRRRPRPHARSPTPWAPSWARSPPTRASSRSPTSPPTSWPSASSGLTPIPDARVFFCGSGIRGHRHGDQAGPPGPDAGRAPGADARHQPRPRATTARTSAAPAPRASRPTATAGDRSCPTSCRCRATTPRRWPC